jgi:Flp pilus assembly pilin Flp
MRKHSRRLDRGQGLLEYGLALIFVAVVVLVALVALGHQYTNLYSNAARGVNNATTHH